MVTNGQIRDYSEHNKEISKDAILIVGGSGFAGGYLAKKLSDNGSTVVTIYRRRLPEPTPNVYPVQSDLSSINLLGAPLRGIDTVVYLAWENNFIMDSDLNHDNLNIQDKNIKTVNNFIKAMEISGVRRIIFLSALGASLDSKKLFLNEKYKAEFAILNSAIKEKIIIRTGLLYSNDYTNDQLIIKIIENMKIPFIYFIPNKNKKLKLVHIDDCVQLIIKTIQKKMEDSAEIITLTSRENFKVETIFKSLARRFLKKRKIPVNGFLGTYFFNLCDKRKKSEERSQANASSLISYAGNEHKMYCGDCVIFAETPINF